MAGESRTTFFWLRLWLITIALFEPVLMLAISQHVTSKYQSRFYAQFWKNAGFGNSHLWNLIWKFGVKFGEEDETVGLFVNYTCQWLWSTIHKYIIMGELFERGQFTLSYQKHISAMTVDVPETKQNVIFKCERINHNTPKNTNMLLQIII